LITLWRGLALALRRGRLRSGARSAAPPSWSAAVPPSPLGRSQLARRGLGRAPKAAACLSQQQSADRAQSLRAVAGRECCLSCRQLVGPSWIALRYRGGRPRPSPPPVLTRLVTDSEAGLDTRPRPRCCRTSCPRAFPSHHASSIHGAGPGWANRVPCWHERPKGSGSFASRPAALA